MEERPVLQSVQRTFDVLETLMSTGPIGLVQLSSQVGLHKSTVHRMLLSLISMGYVKQREEDGRYMPTYKVVMLAEQMMAKVDVVTLLHGTMAELANQVGETVHLVQRIQSDVVYIDKVEPVQATISAIRMASQVGMNRPMYCSGVGKAIMAEMSDEKALQIWKDSTIEKKTEYTITTWKAMQDEIKMIRENGYAMDNEENELGVRCVAVSIHNAKGEAEYAMSISAPISRMEDTRIVDVVKSLMIYKDKMQTLLGAMK